MSDHVQSAWPIITGIRNGGSAQAVVLLTRAVDMAIVAV